jgi:hypothetical protein
MLFNWTFKVSIRISNLRSVDAVNNETNSLISADVTGLVSAFSPQKLLLSSCSVGLSASI